MDLVVRTVCRLHNLYCTPRRVVMVKVILWGGIVSAWVFALWDMSVRN